MDYTQTLSRTEPCSWAAQYGKGPAAYPRQSIKFRRMCGFHSASPPGRWGPGCRRDPGPAASPQRPAARADPLGPHPAATAGPRSCTNLRILSYDMPPLDEANPSKSSKAWFVPNSCTAHSTAISSCHHGKASIVRVAAQQEQAVHQHNRKH